MPTPSFPAGLRNHPFHHSDAVGAVAMINDVPYLISKYEISTNCHGATDTASFSMPISINKDFTALLSPKNTTNLNDSPVYVKIYAGYPQASTSNFNHPTTEGLVLRFLGTLDQYTATFDQDTVSFESRSLAAPLTTQKIQTPFDGPSVTTVQWIQQMAAINGLSTAIFSGINPLTMQQVLGNELQTGVHTYPIWDLMLQCAVQDDVDIWVDATGTLWYYPSPKIPRQNISLKWGQDITSMSMTHGIQFMKNIEVRVHSYIPKTRVSSSAKAYSLDGQTIYTQAVSKTVTSNPIFGTTTGVSTTTNPQGVTTTTSTSTTGGATTGEIGSPANYSGKQIYEKWLKNATQAQCQKAAQQYYRQIVLHEFQVSMRIPVTRPLLTAKTKTQPAQTISRMGIQALINLSGAPYAAINTALWPRQIRETFDPSSGWYWDIEANVNTPAQGGV